MSQLYTYIHVKQIFFSLICNETFGELQCLGTNLSFRAVFDSPDGSVLTCQGFHLHPISGQSVQSAGSLNHLSHLRLCFIGSLSFSKAVPHHPKLIVKLRNEAKKLSPPWSESVIDLVALCCKSHFQRPDAKSSQVTGLCGA